jgi:hypothetical protein
MFTLSLRQSRPCPARIAAAIENSEYNNFMADNATIHGKGKALRKQPVMSHDYPVHTSEIGEGVMSEYSESRK